MRSPLKRIRDYCDSVVRVSTGRENGAQKQFLRELLATLIPFVEVFLQQLYQSDRARHDSSTQSGRYCDDSSS